MISINNNEKAMPVVRVFLNIYTNYIPWKSSQIIIQSEVFKYMYYIPKKKKNLIMHRYNFRESK